ncbi:hypothetical protein MKX01_042201 [Papaver californicum]|nr:hypothetical protein MKX01_042201 [Papaver californicum]
MRPETYLSTSRTCIYHNGSKLPFAAAQVGQAFTTGYVVDLEFLMFPREEEKTAKDAAKLRLGDAVTNGTVNNRTLGYFIGRVYLFLTCLGIGKERLWFHQHLIGCSYGWIQCVGIADRFAYDLRAHSEKKFSAPKEVDNQKIVEALEAMYEKDAMEVKAALELKGEVEFQICTPGKAVTIKACMVSISKETKRAQKVFIPSVIEPSSVYTRPSKAGDEVEPLNVFCFPPVLAPIKSTTMGKRYARTDELGVPFAVTVNTTTTVTIRERDSRKQIRVEIRKVACVVQDVINGVRTWADIQLE